MPTLEELQEWCEIRAISGLRMNYLYDELTSRNHEDLVKRVAKMLKEAYEYGFSQGAGAGN